MFLCSIKKITKYIIKKILIIRENYCSPRRRENSLSFNNPDGLLPSIQEVESGSGTFQAELFKIRLSIVPSHK